MLSEDTIGGKIAVSATPDLPESFAVAYVYNTLNVDNEVSGSAGRIALPAYFIHENGYWKNAAPVTLGL